MSEREIYLPSSSLNLAETISLVLFFFSRFISNANLYPAVQAQAT